MIPRCHPHQLTGHTPQHSPFAYLHLQRCLLWLPQLSRVFSHSHRREPLHQTPLFRPCTIRKKNRSTWQQHWCERGHLCLSPLYSTVPIRWWVWRRLQLAVQSCRFSLLRQLDLAGVQQCEVENLLAESRNTELDKIASYHQRATMKSLISKAQALPLPSNKLA